MMKHMPGNKTFYITTSIPYVNAAPHVGFAFELLLADVLARHHRLSGSEVFFLTGTDEHGKKIQEAAEKAGKSPQDYVDGVAKQFQELAVALGVSNDDFIRTSDRARHIPVAVKVWQELKSKGDIYKEKYEGLYCVGCEAFLREVEIEDGKCRIHQKEVQKVYEENYFFRFSKYAKKVEELIRSGEIAIVPAYRKTEMLNLFSEEGTRDISVSRPRESVGWGIAVPNDDSQMMHVWVDALLNYLSGAGYGSPPAGGAFAKRWPPDAQVIGKDIARFHVMMWPAIVLSLGLAFPKTMLIHGHIAIEGRKMSKSLGNVVDPFEMIRIFGKEAFRYLLLREIPSLDDGDFSFEGFRRRYAADLSNGLGNLVSRVSTLGAQHAARPNVPRQNDPVGLASGTGEGSFTVSHPLGNTHKIAFGAYQSAIDRFDFRDALAEIWRVVGDADKLVDESRLWKMAAGDPSRAKKVFEELAGHIGAAALMLAPFMPETSQKVLGALGVSENAAKNDSWDISFKKPEQPLFPRIESSI